MLGKTIGCVFIISAALLIFLSGHALAAPTQNITIGPSIISRSLNPGTTTSSNLVIINNGISGYSYSIYASPYGVDSQTYQPVFKKLPGFTTISSWFSFKQVSGYLSPNQSKVIAYSISVPAAAAPGSYYAAVFAESSRSFQQSSNNELQIKQRVGSLFYITVKGQASESGSISSWSAPFLQSSPVRASLKLANSGKLYYVSNVNVNFEDLLGNVKYQYETQKIVIPKVIRNIPIIWPKPPIFGLYKITGTATIYGQKHLPTRYVLIISSTVRWVFVFIAAATIILISVQNILVNIFKGRSVRANGDEDN